MLNLIQDAAEMFNQFTEENNKTNMPIYSPTQKEIEGPIDIIKTGTLSSGIEVFCSLDIKDDTILMGYKGKSGQTDAGIIYAPYLTIFTSGIICETNFQSKTNLVTRYGSIILDIANKYYKKLIVR